MRKLFGFCVRLGFGSFCIWNAYAGRATDPKDLWKMEDPVGPENDKYIRRVLDTVSQDPTGKLVLAWGGNAKPDRVSEVTAMIATAGVTPFSWGTTKTGQPAHPLILAYTTPLEPFRPPPHTRSKSC